MEGELWIVEPQRRLVARLEADPALIARGSKTADITGELVYVPPASQGKIKGISTPARRRGHRGTIALMWSHPSDEQAKELAAAGCQGVIAFNSRERYFDPNQVVYSSGPYGRHDPLELGLLDLLAPMVRAAGGPAAGQEDRGSGQGARREVSERSSRRSTVGSREASRKAKGVVFTAHLFDGPVKRGANDNMSGCAIQLEILRALHHLIASGELPRPRRTIHFIWPQEISGTYALLQAPSRFDGPV